MPLSFRTARRPASIDPRLTAGLGGAPYLRPYQAAVQRVGPCFDALLWTSRDSQQARFRAITEMTDLTGCTVLDAGCGTGDLAAHLAAAAVPFHNYIGLDALDGLLNTARARGLPRTEFVQADFAADAGAFERALTAADARSSRGSVIVFSGSLNTMDEPTAFAALERAWHACSHALVFNFLRADAQGRPSPDAVIHRFDSTEMLTWATERTPLVAYRQDYLRGQDGTITMRVL